MVDAATRQGEGVRAALSRATDLLATAGCENPRLDAELLLAEALGATRAGLFMLGSAELESGVAERFDALLARRAAREPVAYILARKAFRRLSLSIDRRALIPRPETELLVEVGLALGARARVADVGTGSGAIALALKDERPDLELWAIDLSTDALELARENAARLDLEIHFLAGDLLAGGPYDAVLANLPYVADGEQLPAEILVYEPGEALFGGPDGLDLARRLLSMVSDIQLIALEVGAGQAPAVEELVHGAGFPSVERLRDLAGHERVLVGRR